jgi:ParB-like chromosome segregation protein Spo0J
VNEPESQTLCQLLIHRGERQWEAIEEAGLIQELHRRFNYSLSEIGRRIGRDKSYVKRRMDLLESLPEEILSQVIAGVISTWAANRVLIPLARAKANRQVRERMLNQPALFIKSIQALAGTKDESPEGKWLHDAKVVCAILDRLRDKADTVFYPNQEQKLRRLLLVRAAKARRLTIELEQKIKERLEYDRPHKRASNPGNGETRDSKADDRQTIEALPQHGGEGACHSDSQIIGQQGVGI